MNAQEFFSSLPEDIEDASRARKYRIAVNESRSSSSMFDLLSEQYRLLSTGELCATSLADINMLTYGLLENPELAKWVDPYMEKFLTRISAGERTRAGWKWVRQQNDLR